MRVALLAAAATLAVALPSTAAPQHWLLGTWEIEWSANRKNRIEIAGYVDETRIRGTYFADASELCRVDGVENGDQAFIEIFCKNDISRLMGELADRPDLVMGQYSRNHDTDLGLFKMRKK